MAIPGLAIGAVSAQFFPRMKIAALLPLLLAASTLTAAGPDVAAIQREQVALDQRNTRESQRIEQAQEEAMIPVRAKVRDLRAKAEREFRAASLAVVPALTAGKTGIDTAAIEQAKFALLEVDNIEANQLEPEGLEPFEAQRQAWSRQHDIAKAKIEAMLFDGMEGGEKARDAVVHKAEIMAKWSEKLDALGLELARAQRQLQLEHTSRINKAEARLVALGVKASAAMNARIQQKLKKGEAPTAEDAAPQPDPAQPAVEAERDEARNALQTALEKVQASFTPRRNELENQRDEELAKIGQ